MTVNTSSDRVLRKRPIPEPGNFDPIPYKSRRIQEVNASSSRTEVYGSSEDLSVDKACRRIFGHYVDAVVQEVLKIRIQQGKTVSQGARGTADYPACHWCPNAGWRDNAFRQFKEKIIQNGVTPNQTSRYLDAKEVDTPTRDLLHCNKGNREFIETLLNKCISPQSRDSALAHTHYDQERNATLTMSIESNRVDSQLEKVIRPLLIELEQKRAKNEITPEESTLLFHKAIDQFYSECIHANELRIQDLELYIKQETLIQSFHKLDIYNLQQFSDYIAALKILLKCKKSLLTSIPRTSSCREIKEWREDYYWLEKTVQFSEKNSLEDSLFYFQREVKPNLKDEFSKNSEILIRKYARYKEDALLQQKGIAPFHQVGAINEIKKLIFGTVSEGVRKTPDETKVRYQVFDLIKRAPRSSGKRTEQAKKGLNFSNSNV